MVAQSGLSLARLAGALGQCDLVGDVPASGSGIGGCTKSSLKVPSNPFCESVIL